MNSNLKNQAIQNLLDVEDQSHQAKTFIQDSFKIDYVNTSKIFLQETSNSSDVKVNNYLCYKQGQNLYKVTEIMYEDKLIRIEDKFEVSMNGANLGKWSSAISHKIQKEEKKYSRNIQKVRMFDKKSNKQLKNQKRDKKNIVKNVVKIFQSWLQKKQSRLQQFKQEQTISQLKKLLQVQNYNNRLIQKIAQNKQINKAFLYFLEDGAEDQIKNSRIQDKQSHYQALQIYKNLLLKAQNSSNQGQQNGRATPSDADQSNQSIMSQKSQRQKHRFIVVEKQFENKVINHLNKKQQMEREQKGKFHENGVKTKLILINNGSETTK